jgi:molybdopterin-guanine dinucleotide biosynthesis protein A
VADRARAFVLAGGRSERFGTDKARFVVQGVPMLLRVAQALSSTGFTVTLVSRDDSLGDLGLPILVEPPGPIHPLSGVLAALIGVGPTGIALIAPCDLPWLDAESVATLIEGAPPRVALGQPLLAWLPGEWAQRTRSWRDAGKPVRSLFAQATQVQLSPSVLLNANRPSDLGSRRGQ